MYGNEFGLNERIIETVKELKEIQIKFKCHAGYVNKR